MSDTRPNFVAANPTANPAAASTPAAALPPLRPKRVDFKLSQDPSQELHNALLEHGFVAIRNCGISTKQLDMVFRSAHSFFDQPDTEKTAARYRDTQKNFGYQPMHTEALDPDQGADGPADSKESFTMRNIISAANPPGTPEGFGATANTMFANCSSTAMRIIDLLEQALGAPQGSIAANHTGENMTLRYLHYPVLSTGAMLSTGRKGNSRTDEKKSDQLGAGAHTDYGTITLLFSDGVAGLQLCDSAGDWRDVDVAAGDVLVNTGDLMSLWSNGLYPSTVHRVQPRLSQPARYSLAFFVDPDSATRVNPLPCCVTKARPATTAEVVAGEHIQARIEASQRA